MLQVVIFVPLADEEGNGHQGPQSISGHNCKPDSVQIQHQGHEQNQSAPEQEGAQEGQQGRDGPVAQCGEESGAVNAKAAEQLAQGEQPKAVDRHLQKLRTIAHESHGQGTA